MLATEMCFISSSRKHYFLVPSLVYFIESCAYASCAYAFT